MLLSAVARTIHCVGHKVLKPGLLGTSCSHKASNAESHFGEYFNNLDISKCLVYPLKA